MKVLFLIALVSLVGCSDPSEHRRWRAEDYNLLKDLERTVPISTVTCSLGQKFVHKDYKIPVSDNILNHSKPSIVGYYPTMAKDEDSKPSLSCTGESALTIGCISLCEKLLVGNKK